MIAGYVFEILLVIVSVYLIVIYINEAIILKKIKKNKIAISGLNVVISVLFFIFAVEHQTKVDEVIETVFTYYSFGVLIVFLYVTYSKYLIGIRKAKYYTLVLDSIKDTKWNIFYLVSKSNKILDISDSFAKELGQRKEKLINKDMFKVFQESIKFISTNGAPTSNEDMENSYKRYTKNIREGDVVSNVAKFYNSKNEIVVLKFTETPIFISGKFKGRMAIGEKRTDKAIFEAEQKLMQVKSEFKTFKSEYMAIYECMQEGVYYRQKYENYVWLTDTMKELIQVEKNSMIIDEFDLHIHRSDYEAYKAILNKLTTKNTSYSIKYRIKSGYSHIWIEERGKLYISDKGERILAVVNKLTEEERLKSDMKLLMANQKHFGLLILSITNIIRINEYITKIGSLFRVREDNVYKLQGGVYAILIKDEDKLNTIAKGIRDEKNELDLFIKSGGIEEEVRPNVSLGIFPNDSKNVNTLIDKIYRALEYTKLEGSKRYIFSSEVEDIYNE